MIVLGIGHPMLKEQVLQRSGLENAEYRKNNPLEMKIADFDDVTYCLKAIDNNLTVFFSMQGDMPAVRACAVPASARLVLALTVVVCPGVRPCPRPSPRHTPHCLPGLLRAARATGYEQVKGFGVEAYLAKAYAGDDVEFNFTSESVGGLTYDFSLTCDLSTDRGEGTEAFAGRISAIRRHVLAACFFYYFETVCAGAAAAKALKIPYRHNEAIYLKKGKEDQVVVIFSVTFSDKNDWVVAEVFLREFADVRRDPALQVFRHTPPPLLSCLRSLSRSLSLTP
jgi:hypothetical protein